MCGTRPGWEDQQSPTEEPALMLVLKVALKVGWWGEKGGFPEEGRGLTQCGGSRLGPRGWDAALGGWQLCLVQAGLPSLPACLREKPAWSRQACKVGWAFGDC